ncbi:MAG: PAS domain S-box protein [Candidatus Aminicenantes bacterium]|nr:PAS domain S-box protein [Candidatus Aminicenantes bacterium]
MKKSDKNMIDPGFEEMANNIPIGLYKTTLDGNFVRVNSFLINMFGFDSEDEIMNLNVSSLYYEKNERDKLIKRYKKINKVKNHEVKLRKKDGTSFFGSITEMAISDDSGKIIYFYGILEDISDKKKREEEITKLATLVDQAAVSIVLTDLSGNIQYVNPWFENKTGYKKDEAIGKNPRILKSKNSSYPEHYFKTMWESINNGDNWLGQFTNQKKSGEEYIEEAAIFPINSKDGKEILGFGAVKKDITQQIELERELEYSLREMESLKEKAESASKLKSIFLANMSHDIRTPLNAIIGFSDLLKKHKLDNKLDGYVNNIIRSGNILLNLINDILDLSKIEAGQMNMIQNTLFLDDLAENIKSIFDDQFRKKKIDFKISKGKNLPDRIYNDQSRIQQILINLLSNSLKYTLKGEVLLKMKYNDRKDIIEFSVKDSGIGIPEEIQDKLFTPFFSNRTLHDIDDFSTGLGLAICKNLAELLEGNIKMSSEFGIGSEFILELPANSSEVEEILQLKDSLFTLEGKDIGEYANKNILIAEDNPVNAELLYEALEMRGFRNISIVTDGEEAIENAIKELPQLIIMDNKMPKVSGLEALRVIRDRGFENPVIILTADAIEELEKDKIKVMPESYLTKPIDFKLLFEEICRVLKHNYKNDKKNIKDKSKNIRPGLIISKSVSENIKNVFLKDLKEKHEILKKAIDENSIENEFESIALIAHSYKGNAGYFGLSLFEDLTRELDQRLKDKRSAKIISDLTIKLARMIEDILSINQ